jgi:hypothetical protein
VTLLMVSALASVAGAQDKPEAPSSQTADRQAGKETLAPDINPAALWDGRKLAPFRALDFPKMVKAADADFMEEGEYVLGLTINGESRAYPTRFIAFHHVINDKVGTPEAGGEAFVTVTY